MKDSKLNLLLYRIILGRQRLSYGGFSIIIHEPGPELILQSYDEYYDDYEYAYINGLYTEFEINNLLIEYDIWNPGQDKEIESIKSEIDNIKIECYENFYNKKVLKDKKGQVLNLNNRITSLLNMKYSMEHLSCDGLAEQSRIMTIVKNTAYNVDGTKYNWDGPIDLSMAVGLYKNNMIEHSDIRYIARNDPWRSMWISSKNTSQLFKRCTTEYTRDQITLCSYSIMYDNVYENPESPPEEIIEDDDCLDGWMIFIKRKRDAERKKQSIEGGIKNEKIKNAKEVMIFADNTEDAKTIYDLNDQWSRSIINQRQKFISESKDKVQDGQFSDIQLELTQKKNEMFNQKFRSK